MTRLLTAALLATLCGNCSKPDVTPDAAAVDLGPGVARSLAEYRSRAISDLSYEISLSIPENRAEAIQGTVTARFTLTSTDQPLAIDFAQPAERIHSVVAGGKQTPYEAHGEHIVLPLSALESGANEVAIQFTAGDGSLNRSDEFLYTLFVPDRARVAMPIFDQPDLKARYRLTLEIPAGWQAIANGSLSERSDTDDRSALTFKESAPISTYVFAFAAGRFDVVSAERDGRTLRMLHRETDTEKVARNLEAIFDLHATALAWLESYTGIPYPFEKLDFLAAPAFQYGGMEHVGAIFYRDRSLFLEETATQSQFLGRASLIAHEVAHMWFGNLVTMQWFNDVWMKEVFANFMAAKIVNPSFPDVDHELRFLLAHYPAAYRIDRTAGANPIRQDLDNLNEAGSLYGAIIYQKAPVVMKHLELLIGEESFRDGLRDYLTTNQYANATWPDLIDVLDRRTDEDLATWSEVWVSEAGRPTVETRLEISDSTADGGGAPRQITSLVIRQTDPAARGRLWTQRLEVLLGYAQAGDSSTTTAQLRSEQLEVADVRGEAAPAYVLANGAGIGYGNFILDESSQGYLLQHSPAIADAKTRAVAWLSLWDAMLEERVAPPDLIDLAVRTLSIESDELNVQRLLDDLTTAYWRYSTPVQRIELAPGLESLLWRLLEAADHATLKGTYLRAYRDIALTDDGVARLRGLWAGRSTIEGLPLSENDTTELAQALAVGQIPDAEVVLDEQRQRITNPDRQARLDFVRPALSAERATRDAFFASLAEEENRQREPWVLEALSFLHHPLRSAESEDYILPSLELLEEIQRTGDIFFPLGWLAATLGGHSSAGAAAVVERFLDERADLPSQLRGKLLQAADPLFRAARIVDQQAGRAAR